jgi:hypothetical protein
MSAQSENRYNSRFDQVSTSTSSTDGESITKRIFFHKQFQRGMIMCWRFDRAIYVLFYGVLYQPSKTIPTKNVDWHIGL